MYFYFLPCNNRLVFIENLWCHPGQSCRIVCSSQECVYIISVLPTQHSTTRWRAGVRESYPPAFTLHRTCACTCIQSHHHWQVGSSLQCPQAPVSGLQTRTGLQPVRPYCAVPTCSHRVTSDSFCPFLFPQDNSAPPLWYFTWVGFITLSCSLFPKVFPFPGCEWNRIHCCCCCFAASFGWQ